MKPSPAVRAAFEHLQSERIRVAAERSQLSEQLIRLDRAIAKFRDLHEELSVTPDKDRTPRRKPNKPTASVSEYVRIVRQELTASKKLTLPELREKVSARLNAIGKSRIAMTVRIAQAQNELGVSLTNRKLVLPAKGKPAKKRNKRPRRAQSSKRRP